MSGSRLPSLYDRLGQRKYVTREEGVRFIEAASGHEFSRCVLAWLLLSTGCRVSEALSLTRFQIDTANQSIVFRTLKRRHLHFRAVPVPRVLLDMLLDLAARQPGQERLWSCCRQTAWRDIKAIMTDAGIHGPQACPRGLRHGFGVACALAKVPPPVTQSTMGHSKAETTAIYQQVVGAEATAILRQLWEFQLLST